LENQNLYIPGLPFRSPEPGILPGTGALIKNQEPELRLKFRTGAGDMAFEK